MVGTESATESTVAATAAAGGSKRKLKRYMRDHQAINVSNVTNSSSPDDLKSRIFIGNLNTNIVTKRHLHLIFMQFGDIRAISMHKGFAFIQYADEMDALNAVFAQDGQIIAGQAIDVNLVTEPKPHQKACRNALMNGNSENGSVDGGGGGSNGDTATEVTENGNDQSGTDGRSAGGRTESESSKSETDSIFIDDTHSGLMTLSNHTSVCSTQHSEDGDGDHLESMNGDHLPADSNDASMDNHGTEEHQCNNQITSDHGDKMDASANQEQPTSANTGLDTATHSAAPQPSSSSQSASSSQLPSSSTSTVKAATLNPASGHFSSLNSPASKRLRLEPIPVTVGVPQLQPSMDLMICGNCRSLFTSISQFISHKRLSKCRLRFVCRCQPQNV